MTTIKDLCTRSHLLAVGKGWYQDRDVSDVNVRIALVALVHSELSEAVEAIRNGEPPIHFGSDGKPEGACTELADAVIRIADMCEALGWDLAEAIEVKHRYNCGRPMRHGGKLA
jgi:NTP pyrophosphatase (non-canonical NTP hydrolase)